MFAVDLEVPKDEGDDVLLEEDAVAEVQDSEEDTLEIEEEAPLPSGLTPYWVKFLLRQGMEAAKAYRDKLGFEYEVDLDKRSQLDIAKPKMAHVVASGGAEFMGEELAGYAATIERLEREISMDPEDSAGDDVTAHAKYSQLLEKCTKAAAKANEDALIKHADLQAKKSALEAEQLELRKQSVAQMTADAKLHTLLTAKVEATASHNFQKVLEASDFSEALDRQVGDLFDST